MSKTNHKLGWTVILILVRIAAPAQTQGIFVRDHQPKKASVPIDYQPVGVPAGQITHAFGLYPTDTVARVSRFVYGTNANIYSGTYNKEPKLVEYMRLLKPQVVRFPGGLHSDEFFWNAGWDWNLKKPDGSSGGWYVNLPADLPANLLKSGQSISMFQQWFPGAGYWSFSVDDYYDFLSKTGSEGLITVNYGYARYGTGPAPVSAAAHLAAQWVRYDKGRTRFWEIGNENLFNWSGSYQINTTLNRDGQPSVITPKLYGEHCRVFIDSMRNAAREIGAEIYIGVQGDAGVLAGVNDKADWYVDHSYYTNYAENSSVAAILNSAVPETKKYADKVVNESGTWGVPVKPLAMTEWNIFAEGSKQAASYVNGIHAVLVLGEMIRNRYGMSNRWDIANAWNNGDDMGMFSRGDDPDGNSAQWNPRAPFYYMYYFQQYFGDRMIRTDQTSGNEDVVVYASAFEGGEVGLVVVNKGAQSALARFTGKDGKGFKQSYFHSLTGGTDNGSFSLKVIVNGQGPAGALGGPIDKLTQIKPRSMSLYGDLVLDLPPLSVQFVLLERGENPVLGVEPVLSPNAVFPNPAKASVSVPEWKSFTSFRWVDAKGSVYGSGAVSPTVELPVGYTGKLLFLCLIGEKQQKAYKIIVE